MEQLLSSKSEVCPVWTELGAGEGRAAAEPANKWGCERMAPPGTQPGQQKQEKAWAVLC